MCLVKSLFSILDGGCRCGFTVLHRTGIAMAFIALLMSESIGHTLRTILILIVELNWERSVKEPKCKYNCTCGRYKHMLQHEL